tara:strand:+ start:26 stop:472 length:447 start_codon:yes stop_codon:yes gene_type:complete
MQRKIIPDIIEKQTICSLKKSNTIFEAATMMCSANIAAIVIFDDASKVIGIVTERDLTRRGIAKCLDPKKTAIEEIMTKNPETLSPNDTANDALELMQIRHFRHLPVVEEETCLGVVSIRDLFVAAKTALEENLRETEAFVFGDRYGA